MKRRKLFAAVGINVLAWVLSLMTALLFGKSLRLSTGADAEQEVQHA